MNAKALQKAQDGLIQALADVATAQGPGSLLEAAQRASASLGGLLALHGAVVTVSTVPQQPLKAGNYRMRYEARLRHDVMRSMDEAYAALEAAQVGPNFKVRLQLLAATTGKVQ